MKTSFSVKVTGSITVSIKSSNENGSGDDAAEANDGGGNNILVIVFLAKCMKA
jgi:hypothetical protein